jgi:hypothetical protein
VQRLAADIADSMLMLTIFVFAPLQATFFAFQGLQLRDCWWPSAAR